MRRIPVLAWHGSEELKADAVRRMRAHRDADRLRSFGAYVDLLYRGEGGDLLRGCFHGCLTLEKVAQDNKWSLPLARNIVGARGWHEETERVWGIHVDAGAVLDMTFEGLPRGPKQADWAVAITEAIPVGADLSMFPARMVRELCSLNQQFVIRSTCSRELSDWISDLIDLYDTVIAGKSAETLREVLLERLRHVDAPWVNCRKILDMLCRDAAYVGRDCSPVAYGGGWARSVSQAAKLGDRTYASSRALLGEASLRLIASSPVPTSTA